MHGAAGRRAAAKQAPLAPRAGRSAARSRDDRARVPGILAFRVEASLLYFNVENVLATVRERLRGERPDVRLVICDLSTSPYVDLAGARMLRDLGEDLAKHGVGLRITDARAATRDLLREEGLEAAVGPIDRFTSVAHVVDAFGVEPARNAPR